MISRRFHVAAGRGLRAFHPSGLGLVLLLICLGVGCVVGSFVTVVGDGHGSIRSDSDVTCRTSCEVGGSLSAVASEHSRFDGWSGACEGFGECTPKGGNVTARFTAVDFPVRVTVGGQGEVNSAGAALESGPLWVPRDTRITLVATPKPGWAFVRWEIVCGARPDSASCELLVDKPLEVTAVFEKRVTLTVKVEGPGAVYGPGAIGRCTTSCASEVRAGNNVLLSAAADANASLTDWSAPCSAGNDCTLTLSDSTTVTARFLKKVEVVFAGNGSGHLQGFPGCAGGGCAIPWTASSPLSFDVVPDDNSRMIGIIGCPMVTGTRCTLTRYTPSIQVTFEKVMYDPIIVAAGFDKARLVRSDSNEYLWLHHYAESVVGGQRSLPQDAGPFAQPWSLYRTLPSVALFGTALDIEVYGSTGTMDGGVASTIQPLLTQDVLGVPLTRYDSAVIANDSAGRTLWVDEVPGDRSNLWEMVSDPLSHRLYLRGNLGQFSPPQTFGSTTLSPPSVANTVQSFIASYDSAGRRDWIVPGPRLGADSLRADLRRLVLLRDGPMILDGLSRDSTADGAACLQPGWAPFLPNQGLAVRWQVDATGRCVRGDYEPAAYIEAQPVDVLGAVAYLVKSTQTYTWSGAQFTDGYSLAVSIDGGTPVVNRLPTCARATIAKMSVVAATGSEVFLFGSGSCVPEVENGMGVPERAFIVRYDVDRGAVVQSIVFRGEIHAALPLNGREVRALVSPRGFGGPTQIRFGGVTYDVPPRSQPYSFIITMRL